MKEQPAIGVAFRRREFLAGTALFLLTGLSSRAAVIKD